MPEDQHLDALKDKAVKRHIEASGREEESNSQILFSDIRSGDRQALAKAITFAESKLPAHREIAAELIRLSLPHLQSAKRLGITGVPGVGKSTLINTLAIQIADLGNRVAILTIDPSSPQSRGSILGDKTRMHDLVADDRIFIRPSPSGNLLGGVALRTREVACLCDAAGFDVILIETVGVGQSETAISNMTDFFLLLKLPGAGDEIQGIKRGIVELADAIFVNKADGEMKKLAEVACQTYKRSLHLFPAKSSQWMPEAFYGSAITGSGIKEIWETVLKYFTLVEGNGYLTANHARQNNLWMRNALEEMIELRLSDPASKALIEKMEKPVGQKEISPIDAASDIFRKLFQE